jgi:hypothetical protein
MDTKAKDLRTGFFIVVGFCGTFWGAVSFLMFH